MATITTRTGKGSVLTHAEVDANFTNLNADKLDVAGVALGSAASPTIKFTGDTDTGLYSPGANQVALGTGGTGRLFIDSSGRVGIGTSSLTAQGAQKLTVDTGNIATTIQAVTSSAGELRFINRPDAVNYNWAGLRAISDVDANNGILAFFTSSSNTSAESSTERLRIDSAGRVLVGTSADSGGALFQVNGDRIRVGTAKTPASATATGTAGEICWDASYIYVCTATNTWKRSALTTW